jgi:hypothetical protein
MQVFAVGMPGRTSLGAHALTWSRRRSELRRGVRAGLTAERRFASALASSLVQCLTRDGMRNAEELGGAKVGPKEIWK